jgi:hypothetical protein
VVAGLQQVMHISSPVLGQDLDPPVGGRLPVCPFRPAVPVAAAWAASSVAVHRCTKNRRCWPVWLMVRRLAAWHARRRSARPGGSRNGGSGALLSSVRCGPSWARTSCGTLAGSKESPTVITVTARTSVISSQAACRAAEGGGRAHPRLTVAGAVQPDRRRTRRQRLRSTTVRCQSSKA